MKNRYIRMYMEFDYTKLKTLVENKGLKTSWIAGQLGVTQNTVRAWMRGDSFPRKMAVRLLSQLLNCKEEDFYKSSEAS